MISQPKTRFQSLVGFFEGTKDRTRDEAYQLAKNEFAILHDWIAKTPDAQRFHCPQEIEYFVDYFAGLKTLLFHLEHNISSATGYKEQLIVEAMKQWDQNATQGSKPDANNRG